MHMSQCVSYVCFTLRTKGQKSNLIWVCLRASISQGDQIGDYDTLCELFLFYFGERFLRKDFEILCG